MDTDEELWHALTRANIHGPGTIELKKRNKALVEDKEKRSIIKKTEISKMEDERDFTK